MCICEFCHKEFKEKGLAYHQKYCKKNPNAEINLGNKGTTKGRKSWNSGKTAKDDPRIAKYANTCRENYKSGKNKSWIAGLTKETDERLLKTSQKISKTTKERAKEGTWHLSFSKSRIIEYNGVKFLGSWEVKFAQYLDSKNIKWERPKKSFNYIFESSNHSYLPDFYLPDYDLYIEIKGYPTKKDFAKWELFPEKLDIYFGDDLVNLLGIDIEYKDCYGHVDLKFRNKHAVL